MLKNVNEERSKNHAKSHNQKDYSSTFPCDSSSMNFYFTGIGTCF